jgi:hypothetical protein
MTDVTVTRPQQGDGKREPESGTNAGLLLVYAADGLSIGRGFALSRGVHLVGRRAPIEGLRLDQPAVSRLHASISVGMALSSMEYAFPILR